jgi:hypothetical protein
MSSRLNVGPSTFVKKKMKPTFEIQTEIIINSTPELIWEVLMDWEQYPEWNPFILSISTHPKHNNQLKINVQGMKFEPLILTNETPTHFEWIGKLFVNGLFDGKHRFELIKISDTQTKFVHSEHFSGWLVPLFKSQLLTKTKPGFEAMNQALKYRTEQHYSSPNKPKE